MKLDQKVILCAGAGVLLATAGAIVTVYSISHENRVNELKTLMSSTIQQAETVMTNVDEYHVGGAFDTAKFAKQRGGLPAFHCLPHHSSSGRLGVRNTSG
jgi:hypothetical protein